MLQQARKKKAAARTIAARPADQPVALSFAQQRLWFLDQWEPGSPAYNLPQAMHLIGPLDVPALRQALQAIVQRHSVLGLIFAVQGEQPIQVPHPNPVLALEVESLEALPAAERLAAARQRADADAATPFALEHDLPIRARLFRLGAAEHLLYLNIHHIAADGWSFGVLFKELGALYAAFQAGQPSPLPDLPIQYADFAHWQRNWLQGDALEKQLAYWKQKLSGAPGVLELPTDHPRPAVYTDNGQTFCVELPPAVSQAIQSLAQQEGVTPFMILLAVYQLLLYRYTSQADIVVGAPMGGRNLSELEGLIGFFVNTQLIRTDLSGNPSGRALLQRVRAATLDAFEHQDLPFEKLVEELHPQRDLSHNPLFQVMFNYQVSARSRLELPGLEVQPLDVANDSAKFDLSFHFVETAGDLVLEINYNTDLFERQTINRMVGHFEMLLAGLAADPQRPILDLPLLTAAERQEMLETWNQTARDFPAECLHSLVAAQARRTPRQTAISFEGQTLTYAELDARANQLAHALQALGVGPNKLVAVSLERSLEMVIGLLGALKAGAAYLPLDPNFPAERLAYMLADSGAPVLLTTPALRPNFPTFDSAILYPDADAIRLQPEFAPPNTATPEDLAYVIYTSGSTGKPKGTLIPHRAVVNFLASMRCQPGLEPGEILLSVTTFSFDIAALEIFLPLFVGGQVTLVSREVAGDGLQLRAALEGSGATAMQATPATWRLLLDAGWPGDPRLKILCGGEALPQDLADRLQARGASLWNLYGPTETTIWSTLTHLEKGQPVRIGRPIHNTQCYVLDTQRQPVPIGVPGELYIGGAGLAHGYLNRPELTAEKFVQNPFQPGERLYRTGDLVRYHSDGSLEYLGRMDFQVKLRGFRIELGEIETALAQHPALRAAVVVARQDAGGPQLVAYFIPGQAAAPDANDLRNFLRQSLPDYMIPAAFVSLDAFPLTANGKINRLALPAPDPLIRPDPQTFVAPSTPFEEIMADIFCEVLKVDAISVHHNFFDLGGHSLLATQVMSRVYDRFDARLPVRTLFEAPTLGELARRIEQACPHHTHQKKAATHTIPARPADQPIALSFAQQRLWMLDQLEPGNPAYNFAVTFHLRGELDGSILRQALQEIIHRHKVLGLVFTMRDEQPIQVPHPNPRLALEVESLEALPVAERLAAACQYANADAATPFALERDLPIRARLFRLGAAEHVLCLNMHHIASDGWSLGILLDELSTLYASFLAGRPSPLPDLPIQYADFAHWQRDHLQGEALEQQLTYWKQKLSGAPGVLELPTDHPRPAVHTSNGQTFCVELPPAFAQAVKTLAQQEGATPFMVLLAVYQLLLYRYTGQDNIVVGAPLAGRNLSEVEGLIGFFVNTEVIRTDLSGNPSGRALLQRVRDAALDAFEHQDLPFEKLVEELHPQRDLSHNPLFQVMFNYQVSDRLALKLPGVEAQPLDVENGSAKFDLHFHFVETAGELALEINYNTDLFERQTVNRMIGHFEMLLRQLAADPQRPILDLPLLTAAERQEMLETWNATQVAYPPSRRIQEIIEAQAAQTPDALAVAAGANELTYRELNQRANQLARRLRQLGVGPEVFVGLYMGRAVEMLIGILGILKAGGAYVPLDPAWPAARLNFALQDTRMPVILTLGRLRSNLPPTNAHILCLDADWASLDGEADANLGRPAAFDHLAYAIYTSGSTGTPKGVMVTHDQLAHSIGAHLSYYRERVSGYLLLSPFAFDSSVTGIFWTLCQGGVLTLPPDNFAEDIACLPDLIARRRLSHVVCVPSLYNLLLVESAPEDLASLRCVIVAGEVCPKALVERHAARLPLATLYNEYGPTECSVWSTVYRCGLTSQRVQIPIGRPIENVQLYVLDARLQPVPVGVVGEMFIGGSGVTRGYLNQPALTAERFLPNPFSPIPGERFYQTGDLVRYLPDGNLEFVGRCDNQVKLHGFRIELDEIDAILRQHPLVRETAVLISDKTEQLLAYLVPHDGQTLDVEAVRRYLQDKLPAYMTPSVFVLLDKLPRTPTGKVDLRALPEPEQVRPRGRYLAPRTPVEQTLAEIWAAVLGLEQVGVEDNFFNLGGDSIISIQIASRARRAGLNILPKQLFQAQTIAELAALAHQAAASQAEQGVVSGPLPLTPIQRWFFEQGFAEPQHFNQAVLLETSQPLDVARLSKTLEYLWVHHDALRMKFEQVDGKWQQINRPLEGAIPLSTFDLTGLPPDEQRAHIERQTAQLQASLNLSAGPLAQVAYWNLGPDRPGRLFIAIHHLVVDAVSWQILLEDFDTVYGQLGRGEMVHLPPKTTSFRQWAIALEAYAASPTVQQELSTWLQQNWAAVSTLPVDDPDAANTLALEQTLWVSLTTSETQALLQDVPWAYRTQINDVLLAALAHAFANWTGNPTLLVDVEGHGREEISAELDLSRTLGWFTAVYPLLLRVADFAQPWKSLPAVKEQLRSLPAHGLHYGLLHYGNTHSAEAIRALPQAQVLFNYLGQTDQSLADTLFAPAPEEIGPSRSPRARRAYLLEINSSVQDGRLQLAWAYSQAMVAPETITALADDYLRALRAIIAHCQSTSEESDIQAADFPAARVSQEDLQKFLNAIG
jgi:amino acid adenylation domain-containing protein/non-ribosomal peptide synthase protein (TIGR01720 family)